MLKTGGENLDARLLRFRTDPASEDAGRLAEQLLRQSRASEALEVLAARLAVAPNDVAALMAAGRAYLVVGELLRAQQTLMQAAKLAPDAPTAYRWLGEVLLKRGDPGRAVKVLEKAKAGSPGDREVDQLLARAQRLAKLADGELPQPPAAGGPGAFRDEAPTAKHAYGTAPEVSVPRVGAAAEPTGQTAVASIPMPPAAVPPAARSAKPAAAPVPPAPAAPPGRVPRRPAATQMGIGQLGAVIPQPPPKAAPPPAAPTVVAEALRARLERELARLDRQDSRVTDPGPESQSITAVFDEQTTGLHDRPSTPPSLSAARPLPPRPSVRPVEARPPAVESEIPASVPPRPAKPRPVPPAPRASAPIASPTAHARGGAAARPGGPEDVDAILTMLEEERIFEPPTGEPAVWAEKAQIERGGTRVGRFLIGLWVLGVLAAGGGYYGFQEFTRRPQLEAARLRDEAEALGLRGDDADLDRAMQLLDRADELQPTAVEASAIRLALLSEQALESGGVDRSLLRAAVDRAERARADGALVGVGRAVVAYAEARASRVIELLGEGGSVEESRDAWVMYLRGRLLHRLGRPASADVLAGALAEEPNLVSAELALAEIDAESERGAEALERIGRVLAREPSHLRAQLWKAFLEADTTEPDATLANVASLDGRLREAGPTDRALARLLEARALRRKGETTRAADAIERAVSESVTSPRVLVLLAREAASVGALGRAQQAASTALAASPDDVRARALLAELQLDRGDAQEALRTLSSLSTDDPDVLRLSARAALVIGGPALEAADTAMDAYLAARSAASVDMQALSLRMKSRRAGQASELLAAAERLSRSAPGDVHALTALAEIALDAREPSKALSALERLVAVAGDHASTHFLLGRARRMAGDADGAREALRRAIEIEPAFGEAKVALGYLLLDMGDYEGADALYTEMARGTRLASGGSTALMSRLGRVEALLGLGRVADAKVQLEGVPQRDAETVDVRVTAARVALAENRPADALAQLRPVAEAEGASADLVALYGDALYAAGETEAASTQYTRALQTDSGSPEGLVGYAQILVRGEKFRDAEDILARAAEALRRRVRPPALRARMLVLRGRVHLAENDRSDAVTALRQASELPAAPVETWFYLGEALSGSNVPEARAAYGRYVELAPDGPLAERARRAMR